jgi:1,2-diacylglycerol 3-alpha-glucosyltransferase
MTMNLNNDSVKTIGLFNDSFPPIMDGVALTVANYAHWLYRKNQPVCVITPKSKDFTIEDPYPVYRYSSWPLIIRKPYRIGMPSLDLIFQDTLDRIPFSIVHAHCPFTSGHLALKIARDQKIPLIATFHSKYRDDFESTFLNKRVAEIMVKEVIKFYEKADQVWIPQAAVEETLREYGYKGKVIVVENGNDLSGSDLNIARPNARVFLNLNPDLPVFIFVGQHIWEKNTRMIIESLGLLQDVDFKMFFVGTGYAAEEMSALVDKLGLTDKVTFTGVISDREILKKYYAAADLMIFPSIYDNAPLVVREAAAMGTPAILVKNSTAAEVVSDNFNGFLVENSAYNLADKLKQLIFQKENVQKVGLTASQTIARSWENIVEEVLDRYKICIKNH